MSPLWLCTHSIAGGTRVCFLVPLSSVSSVPPQARLFLSSLSQVDTHLDPLCRILPPLSISSLSADLTCRTLRHLPVPTQPHGFHPSQRPCVSRLTLCIARTCTVSVPPLPCLERCIPNAHQIPSLTAVCGLWLGEACEKPQAPGPPACSLWAPSPH